jgi:hypothetical protein
MIDGEDLVSTLKQAGCSLYLCGHWHVMGRDHYVTRQGVRIWTQGRSGALDQDGPPFRHSYDLIRIQAGRVHRETRVAAYT